MPTYTKNVVAAWTHAITDNDYFTRRDEALWPFVVNDQTDGTYQRSFDVSNNLVITRQFTDGISGQQWIDWIEGNAPAGMLVYTAMTDIT